MLCVAHTTTHDVFQHLHHRCGECVKVGVISNMGDNFTGEWLINHICG